MCGLNVLHPHDENQRKVHHRECLAEHEKRMEEAFAVAKSAEMECGICMEVVVEKGLRFGILQNCSHCFCLECIRKWRKHEQRALDLNEQHIEVY
jgi:E3 ubiquitin-protein ligase makorin